MKYTKIVDQDAEQIITSCTPELLTEKLKNKTVLVTGASGMVGSYFIYTILTVMAVVSVVILKNIRRKMEFSPDTHI